jgi:hypothetical protein
VNASRLRDFAAQGFQAVPGEELAGLAEWCWSQCEESGDARFCSIAETLRSVDSWWREHNEPGGAPVRLIDEISDAVKTMLPPILDTESPAEGSQLAREFRERVQLLLQPPSEWQKYLN